MKATEMGMELDHQLSPLHPLRDRSPRARPGPSFHRDLVPMLSHPLCKN